MSSIIGQNRDVLFPKTDKNFRLTSFYDIAGKFLNYNKLEPIFCKSEMEAREIAKSLGDSPKEWPVYISNTDTAGEKLYEEFFTDQEKPNFDRFIDLGVMKLKSDYELKHLDYFLDSLNAIKESGTWERTDIVRLLSEVIPTFNHKDANKNLDQKM